MAGLFDERERGYEAKWAHDEETLFRILARRNELLGRWAASELGLSGAAAADYVQATIKAGPAGKSGVDAVFEKIRGDFAARDIAHSGHALHGKIEDFFTIASRESIKRDPSL
jgi:hypothetical protein